jgi:hypothetical protein
VPCLAEARDILIDWPILDLTSLSPIPDPPWLCWYVRTCDSSGSRLLGQDRDSKARPSPQVPHGIDYPLTLHDKYGKRVLGFDNAHAAPKEGGRFSPRRVEYDHWHPDGRTIEVYEFTNAGKLVEDFFAAVDRMMKDGGTTWK